MSGSTSSTASTGLLRTVRVVGLWLSTGFRADPGRAFLMCLTSIAGALLPPLTVLGISRAVDAAGAGRPLVSALVLISAPLLLSSVAAQVGGPLGDTLDDKIWRYVHDDLIRLTVQVPSLSLHEHPGLADRFDKLRDDSHRLTNIWQLLSVISSVVGVATVLALLVSVHPLLVVLLVAAVVPGLVDSRAGQHYGRLFTDTERYRRLANKVSEVLRHPGQAVETRAFGLGPLLSEVARRAFDSYRLRFTLVLRRFAIWSALAWALFGAVYVVAGLWMFGRLRSGEASVADLTLVLLIGAQVSTTGAAIADNLRTITDSLPAFDRYLWLREWSEHHTWPDSVAAPPDRLRDGIRFEGVGFAYPTGTEGSTETRTSLSDVDLHLPAGSIVAIVGFNGAGKSTMVKLLSRLYDPTQGRILVDGVPMTDLDPVRWRRRLSAGFQDYATLELLAATTVGVGDTEAAGDLDRVRTAVRAGQAEPVIANLPAGLDTQLGTEFAGGVSLSGGQWQRLALSRAFMRTDPLLMLLDEPTAALDPEAEQAVYEQYGRTARDLGARTGAVTVLVSHRFSTVRMADLIVVVEGGRVIETGTHEDLLSAAGPYADLFTLQAAAYR